jgi:hypothetical protein
MSYYKSRQTMVRGRNGLYYRQDAADSTGTPDTGNSMAADGEPHPMNQMNDVGTTEYMQPCVKFNIPTLIRILELVREDVVSDDMLHFLVEKIVEVGAGGDIIDMDEYEEIASIVPTRMMAAQRRSRDGRRL